MWTDLRLAKHFLINGLFLIVICAAQAQTPIILSVDRLTAKPREIVRLHGSDFGTDASSVRVLFGGAQAQIRSLTNQTIEVYTPSGATFERIRVVNTSSGRSATAPKQFFMSYGGEAGITAAKFSTQSDFQAQSGLYDLCLCDFNGDGKPDVATASTTSNLATIFENTSTPENINLAGRNVLVNARTLHVRCGDFNGDGRPDIALTEASDGSRLFVLTNNGNFNFSVQTLTLTGMKVKQLAIVDLDLDGRPEIVVTNTGGNAITILPNTTRSFVTSFSAPRNVLIEGAISTDALAAADLDGDLYPEIITSQYQADNGNKLFILRNDGSLTFSDIRVIAVNKAVSSIRIADLDADEKPDIAISRLTGSDISVYLNQSSLTFRDPAFYITETLPVGMDFSDFDGDGKLDIAVGSIAKSVSILNNVTETPGSSAFSPVVKVPSTYINRNIRAADMDGDGKPDLVFTSVDDFSGVPVPSSMVSIIRNLSCMVPDITPRGPLSVCEGTPLRLKATHGGGVIYEWRREDSGTSIKTGTEDYLDVTTSGSYRVVASSGQAACSRESSPIQVTFEPPANALSQADPNARSNSPVCTTNTLTLQVDDVGASEYRWRGPDGFLETSTSPSLSRPDFSLDNAGLYIVEMISGSCIAKTDSILVESVSIPEFTISSGGSALFCAGSTKTLQITPALASGFSYQWYESASGPIAEATADNYTATASGDYYATIIPDNAGCIERETPRIELVAVDPPSAAFDLPATGCVGQALEILQHSAGSGNATLAYQWTFGNGGTSSEATPALSYDQANTFSVNLKVYYQGLETCNAAASKNIQIHSPITAEIIASASSLCDGEAIALSVADAFTQVTWSTNETTPEIEINAAGTYSVSTQDLHGCPSSDEIVLTEKPTPALSAVAANTTIAAGESAQLEATGADVYQWSPGSTLSDSTIANPIASPRQTTAYVVTGSLADGCSATASVTIQVSGEVVRITVPVLFSPNGDNVNEMLVIEGVENYPDCSFVVFDKRGGRVFGTVGYKNNWDGTVNGSPLPEGVYYYVFGCPNRKSTTGTVTVIR